MTTPRLAFRIGWFLRGIPVLLLLLLAGCGPRVIVVSLKDLPPGTTIVNDFDCRDAAKGCVLIKQRTESPDGYYSYSDGCNTTTLSCGNGELFMLTEKSTNNGDSK